MESGVKMIPKKYFSKIFTHIFDNSYILSLFTLIKACSDENQSKLIKVCHKEPKCVNICLKQNIHWKRGNSLNINLYYPRTISFGYK